MRAVPLVVLALLTACAGGGEGPAKTAAGPTFRNPVHAENFPDPFVLRVGDSWYAYATNDEDGNVRTLSSRELVHWTQGRDALPELGPWAYPGKTWAPEVLHAGAEFLLYYTANSAEAGAQCIGAAIADSPAGLFVDADERPLVCQRDEGGSIDPSPFRDDDGSLYLLWKNDGNSIGADMWIYAQRLSDDGHRLEGRPARLVKQDAGWEANVVEAPTLLKHEGGYYLFFSANAFDGDLYAVGYATCEAPLGPCEDAPYHAWPRASDEEERELWLERLVWEDGKPVVKGPTCRPQPAP